MKTIKFIFSLLVSLMLVLPTLAETPLNDGVYAKDITTPVGNKAELPIVLKTTKVIKAIQFNITIPNGISFVPDNIEYLVTNINPALKDFEYTARTKTGESKQSALISIYSQDATLTLPTGDNTLLSLVLKVDDNANIDNAIITISDVVFSDVEESEYDPLEGGSITSTVSEGPGPDGYAIEITPFSYANTLTDISVNMDNEVLMKSFSFSLTLPDGLSINKNSSGNYVVKTGNRTAQKQEYDEDEGEDITIYSTSRAAVSTDGKIFKITCSVNIGNNMPDKTGETIKLPFVGSLATGIYVLKISDAEITDVNGNLHFVDPYTADIYVGSSTPIATIDANGSVAFHGNYSVESAQTLMNAALSANDITTIDLSKVTAATKIEPQNPNAIIRCTKDLGLDQPNVVIGDVCANLVLTDGHAFRNTEEFTANTASYSRTMTNHSWGTLCLPFAATSTNANVYTLNSVTTGADGEMKFTQAAAAAVEANTPCVIKKDAEDVTFAASNVMVGATPAESKAGTGAPDWTLNGTTIDLNFTTDLSSLYFINGDQFWQASNSLHVAPFRAYFNGPAGSLQAKFRITEETNGIETIENEAEAGVIYDLQGRAVEAAQAGQIYVQGAKKFVVK